MKQIVYQRAPSLADVEAAALGWRHREQVSRDYVLAAVAAAATTEYVAGTLNHLDYSARLAECQDPEGFDFDAWYATYQPPADLEDQGLTP